MVELITEEEANEIINSPKRITEPIVWKEIRPRTMIFSFSVPIKVDRDDITLTLEGSYNMRLPTKFSFKIMLNGKLRIKALDMGRSHRRPGDHVRVGKKTKKHKHTWTDEYKDNWAYEPDDITTGGSIEKVFWEFLAECNIIYEGEFSLPQVQMELDYYEMYGID